MGEKRANAERADQELYWMDGDQVVLITSEALDGEGPPIPRRPEPHLANPLTVIPEADFQATVVDLGRLHGWIVGYTHDSRRSEPGEPDLRMVHETWRRVIIAECKDQTGQLTPGRWTGKGRNRRWLPGQDDWARALKACPGVEYYLWRPSDSDQVEAILGSPRPPA